MRLCDPSGVERIPLGPASPGALRDPGLMAMNPPGSTETLRIELVLVSANAATSISRIGSQCASGIHAMPHRFYAIATTFPGFPPR